MPAAPADYPPPVEPGEFVTAPEAAGDEVIEVGVLFVGGGPAGMIGAIRFAQLLAEHPEVAESLGEVPVAVIDKGSGAGMHQLSGAVVVPDVLHEMFPDVDLADLTSYGAVEKEQVLLLTGKQAMPIVPTPRPFRNHGNHIFSLSKLTRALAERAEDLGVMILPETTATKLLVADGVVRGVLTGDHGRGKEGEQLANFEPGAELHAKATVLCDGTAGNLSMAAIEHFGLAGENPQTWELGVKEVWKVAQPLDRIIHTMGWPLRFGTKYHEFGGSFIYPQGRDHIVIGMVVGLDYTDARTSVHDLLQQLKTHPKISRLLEGGERVAWGAKSIPASGFFALPTSMTAPGLALCGDAAGTVNVPTLKGVHLAMRTGKLAAEAIFDVVAAGGDPSAPGALSGYDVAWRDSSEYKRLHQVRNMRQAFQKGFFAGGALAFMMDGTEGAIPGARMATHPDAAAELFVGRRRDYPTPDGKLTFDKLSSVFASGNKTRDDQPNHIRIRHRVPRAVAIGWVNLCPAAVYELAEGVSEDGPDDELVDIELNPSNCIHCGAITAKGGRFTPPEGGSGPEYSAM